MGAPVLLLLLLAALLAPSAARAPHAQASAAPTVQVRVGVLLPELNLSLPWSWPRVAPALSLALEALQPQLSLDGISVRTAFASTEEGENGWRDAVASVLKAAELKGSHDPDVLLGLSSLSPDLAEPFEEYWRLPLLRAGLHSTYVTIPEEVYAGPLGPSLAAFRIRLSQHFNWTGRALRVESSDRRFFWVEEWCQLELEGPAVYVQRMGSGEQLGKAVRSIQAKSRVVFICGTLEDLHQIMHLAHAENMTNGEYVFFYIDFFGESLRAGEHREAGKPWQSNKIQDTGGLQEAFQTVLVISPHEPQTPEYQRFEKQIILRTQRDFGVAINDSLGHLVAGCYHDVLLLYFRALNETLREGGTKRDTSRILGKMRSLKVQGVTGTVSINSDNKREMDFNLWAMRDVETGEYQVVAHYIASEDRINWTGGILWKKGGPPLDNPPCVLDKTDPSCVKRMLKCSPSHDLLADGGRELTYYQFNHSEESQAAVPGFIAACFRSTCAFEEVFLHIRGEA